MSLFITFIYPQTWLLIFLLPFFIEVVCIRPSLHLRDVRLLLGNDLAGDKFVVNPLWITYLLLIILRYESRNKGMKHSWKKNSAYRGIRTRSVRVTIQCSNHWAVDSPTQLSEIKYIPTSYARSPGSYPGRAHNFCYEPGVTSKEWKINQQLTLNVFIIFIDNKK